jgi:hypothetical protein
LENIRGNRGDVLIWVVVNKTIDSMVHLIANLVADKLDIEVPYNPHSICSKVLHHAYYSTVARFVKEELTVLWLIGFHEKVLILLLYNCIFDAIISCMKDILMKQDA